MISVLLTILKVIGIILLVILGLILLILLLVLFVPFRYQVKADGEDKTWGARAKVGWLGYLIQANVIFEEMKLQVLAKAFGFKVYDTGPKALGKKKDGASHVTEDAAENAEASEEAAKTTDQETQTETVESVTETVSETSGIPAEEEASVPQNPSKEETAETEEIVLGSEPVEEEDADIFTDFGAHTNVTVFAEPDQKETRKGNISLWNRLDAIYEKIDTLLDKVEPILEFLQEDDTKDLFGGFFGTIGRLLKHILPNRLSGDLIVGTGDPVNTAKMVAVMSVLYPRLPEKFHFEGYFIDKKIAADDLTISGRIRLGSMAGMLIGLVLKRYTLRTIKRAKRLIKTLKEEPQEG